MESVCDPCHKTCFGGDVTYTKFVDYLRTAHVTNFKRDSDFSEITEHVGELQIRHGRDMYREIKKLCMIDDLQLNRLVKMNDMVGNPYTYKIVDELDECSPNSIKYVYYGLLVVRHMVDKVIEHTEFVEIGGGYGGQCIILLELFKMFGIRIHKYVLVDLGDVVAFQKKYIQAFGMDDKCVFVPYDEHATHSFKNAGFLLSSYSLSELTQEIREEYYKNVLTQITHGLVIWNNPFCVDLPKSYTKIPHSCHEIVGSFLKF